MSSSLVLIGPNNSGKTTLAPLLANALGFEWLDLDDLRWGYYAEIGYDVEQAKEIRAQGGLQALMRYWKPFDIHAVERVLADHPQDCVIAFGAGHSVYDDPAQFARAQAALSPFPHIILLLPSPDIEISAAILEHRLRAAGPELSEASITRIMDSNRYFLQHPANARLATHTVYTAAHTPEQTCAAILRHMNRNA